MNKRIAARMAFETFAEKVQTGIIVDSSPRRHVPRNNLQTHFFAIYPFVPPKLLNLRKRWANLQESNLLKVVPKSSQKYSTLQAQGKLRQQWVLCLAGLHSVPIRGGFPLKYGGRKFLTQFTNENSFFVT